MRPDPLSEAAARRHELTRSRAVQALRELDRAGTPVTFAGVAQQQGSHGRGSMPQPDISGQIRGLRQETNGAGAIPAGQRSTDASLRTRLTAALDRNKQLTDENARLRRQLATFNFHPKRSPMPGVLKAPTLRAAARCPLPNHPWDARPRGRAVRPEQHR